MPTVSRSEQSRLAVVIAILIGTVLASAIAALASAGSASGPAPQRVSAQAVTLGAFDAALPAPIDISFAKPAPPAQPGKATERRPARQQAARSQSTRTTRSTRPASTSASSPLCSGDGWIERRGAAALASLRHATPPGVTISFLPGRGALKGMTYYDRHHVEVYVQSCARESDSLLRHVVAHELGHAWDSLHMTEELRTRYLAARGIKAGTPWFGCDKCQDFATPAGDFAETYAQWQRGASDSRSTIAPPATQAQLASLAAEFFS